MVRNSSNEYDVVIDLIMYLYHVRQPMSASSLALPMQPNDAYLASFATIVSNFSDAPITGSSTRWVAAISRQVSHYTADTKEQECIFACRSGSWSARRRLVAARSSSEALKRGYFVF